MGLFSGLETLGLKHTDIEIYEKPEAKEEVEKPKAAEKKEFREEDVLFRKSYNCPVCDADFKTLTVRTGKVRSVGQGDYLRPLYKDMDPLKYDAVVCPYCGYAALSRYFNSVMPIQRKRIQEQIGENFKGLVVSKDKFSYEEAVVRYKMVLYCDVVAGAKNSRKAYSCLKLAWLIQGMLDTEKETMNVNDYIELQSDEQECIKNAYEGYTMAFSNETFPMSGMDEVTVSFLLAELAYKLGKYRESLMQISRIMGHANAPARIKDKALDLKEQIREQVKNEKVTE